MLKEAYKERRLKENVNEYLDKIETKDTRREYLTMEELHKLVDTPCEIPVLKSASLFSCLTGLRINDILSLDWNEISPASEGGYCMRLRTDKTETGTTLPIGDEALELCGERKEGKVFKGLERKMTQYPLKRWILEAGITKKISFHQRRHNQ